MQRNEVLRFIRSNPAAFVATQEGDIPRVRCLMTFRADEEGITFATGTLKDVARQLRANPNVELCYLNREQNFQLRITGRAVELDDLLLKQQVVEKFTLLKPWIEQEGLDALALFRIPSGRATVWSPDNAFDPKGLSISELRGVECDRKGNRGFMKIARRIILFLLGLLAVFFALGTLMFVVISKIARDSNLPEAHEYVEIAFVQGGMTLSLFGILIWQARKR